MRVIGIDCATDDTKVGVALAEWQPGELRVLTVETCTRERQAATIAAEWLDSQQDALLAIDAPLGWPVCLGESLARHEAGVAIAVDANLLFRRATDRFVKDRIGKTPLDVGADRIARTAHAALDMLGRLRSRIGAPIPLVWDSRTSNGPSAIEVYPAATLTAHGFSAGGYKKPEQMAVRQAIFDDLCRVMTTADDPVVASRVAYSADALDAVVCLLAAKDFLEVRAMPPEDLALARREGWIWVRDPAGSRPGAPRDQPATPVDRISRSGKGGTVPTAITETRGLTSGDVTGRAVLCPACELKRFARWPLGWDAHAERACPGLGASSGEERKMEFKRRFRHLFR